MDLQLPEMVVVGPDITGEAQQSGFSNVEYQNKKEILNNNDFAYPFILEPFFLFISHSCL